jgi:hypothetical protein
VSPPGARRSVGKARILEERLRRCQAMSNDFLRSPLRSRDTSAGTLLYLIDFQLLMNTHDQALQPRIRTPSRAVRTRAAPARGNPSVGGKRMSDDATLGGHATPSCLDGVEGRNVTGRQRPSSGHAGGCLSFTAWAGVPLARFLCRPLPPTPARAPGP